MILGRADLRAVERGARTDVVRAQAQSLRVLDDREVVVLALLRLPRAAHRARGGAPDHEQAERHESKPSANGGSQR